MIRHSLSISQKPAYLLMLPIAFLLGTLLALSPAVGLLVAVLILLVLSAWRSSYTLLLAVLVFAVFSTLPGISESAESLQIELLPDVIVNSIGLVRTLLAVLVLVRVGLLGRKKWSLVRRNGLFFLFLWIYAALSLAWSPRWALGEGLRLLVYFSLAFGVYFLSLLLATRRTWKIHPVVWIFLLAIVIGVGSLVNLKFLPEITSLGIGGTNFDRGDRLIGLTASSNILAGDLSIFMALGIAFLLTPHLHYKWRWLAVLAIGLALIPLLLTYSRSGWVGAGLAVGLGMTLRRKWLWLGVLGFLGVVLLFGSSIGSRFLGDWESVLSGADLATIQGYQNAYGRIEMLWLPALQELVTPVGVVLGRGAGVAQSWALGNFNSQMHSELLQIWLDFGSLGLGFMLLGFGVVVRRAYRLFRSTSAPIAVALGMASLCVLAATLPQFLWQQVFNGPSSWLLLMICGLMMGQNGGREHPIRLPSDCRSDVK